mgnify:CR=1 FL=1
MVIFLYSLLTQQQFKFYFIYFYKLFFFQIKIINLILKFYFNSFEYDEFYGIEVKGVCSGDTIILPAEFIFLSFRQQYSGKEQFNFIDATGLACHENEQLAIQNGVCELIERDQLASMWYKIPSKVIEIENNEDFICEAQKKIVFSLKNLTFFKVCLKILLAQ